MVNPLSESSSAEAINAASVHAEAVERARVAQIQETVQETARVTKEALLESLKEVFGDGDNKDPEQMKILVRRIPILCTNVEAMHERLDSIDENIRWAVRIILGGVLLAILKLVLIP